jgi:hypothetical protein
LFDGEDFIAMEYEWVDNDYRLHGTNQKMSIGAATSHGCIRMFPQDAKRVVDIIEEYVGVCGKGQTENGPFVVLCRPVRLVILR